MDIYEYLKMDHQKVAKLFELFKSAKTDSNRLEIIKLVCKELIVHTNAEAETFYKALEEANQRDVIHSEQEHLEIKSCIIQIKKNMQHFATVVELIMKLKMLVELHVCEEETKIFKIARKTFTKEEATILKEKMHCLKGKFINHLHIKEFDKLIIN